MIPQPEVLQRLYPCAPGHIPSRPWWTGDHFHAIRTRAPWHVVHVVDLPAAPHWADAPRPGVYRWKDADWQQLLGACRSQALQCADAETRSLVCWAPYKTAFTDLEAAMADTDGRLAPLPHPGLRVGQVWGRADGEGVHVMQIMAVDRAGSFAVYAENSLGAAHARRHSQPDLDSAHARWSSPAECINILLTGCALLADPCCPWMAPWAPCAEASDV